MSKSSIIGILLAVVFCFSGCSWFDMGGTKPGSGGGGDSTITDDRLQDPQDKPNFPNDFDYDKYSKIENESFAKITQGTRATYIPTKFDETHDTVLTADRQKFAENASLQYEIVARAVLFYLSGRYGETSGNETLEIIYEFYADTSLLPDGDAERAVITLPRTTPLEKDASLLYATDGAIETQTTGLTGEYTLATNSWDLSRRTTNQYKWNFSLNTAVLSGYNQNFIETYTPIVQVNLMENALGLPLTSKAEIQSIGAENLIANYVDKIQQLGIKQTQDFADFLYDYILSIVIGDTATSWDNLNVTYTEPADSYTIEVPSEEDPEQTVEQTVYVYYDMDSNQETHTFTTRQLYSYDYNATVRDIVDIIAGTFDAEGNVVNPAIFAEFPTYTRVEITDISPELFYTDGEKGESDIKRLNSMEYHEYQSAIIYPNGIFNYDDLSAEESEDLTQKLWQFDLLNIYIDSKQDITLDIYVRLHINGTNYIEHISRLNTDSTKSFDYVGESTTQDDDIVATDVDAYFTDDKFNYTTVDMRLFFDDTRMESLSNGIENTTEKNFYFAENAYKDTFVGKLGSSVSFGNDLKVTNHYGETVDLNKYALCNDTNDFVEIIFAPVKDNGENYDYSFKFLVKAMFFGVIDTNE